MKLGFVGTGTISAAVIAGLMRSELAIGQIVVTPRNAETARRLAERYPPVSIGADNQAVIDRSEIIFLAVRSQVAEEIIRPLRFRPGQHLVSFIPGIAIDAIVRWVDAPVKITQALPLPFVADGLGATAFYPPDETMTAIFSKLGTAVPVADRSEYELLTTGSAVMGTYFGILECAEGWLAGNGVPALQARAYLRQLFAGLAHAMDVSTDASFSELRSEFLTKGGLNEQIFRDFQAGGGTAALERALAAALTRV